MRALRNGEAPMSKTANQWTKLSPEHRLAVNLARGIIVDPCDEHLLRAFTWRVMYQGYACRGASGKGVVYLHRVIMDTPRGLVCDHINGVTLDNRRVNLRNVTRSMNGANRVKLPANNTSGKLGVSWNKLRSCWEAYVKVGGVKRNLGLFRNLEEAARAASKCRSENLLGYIERSL